jgi:hypothetical protein
MIADREDDVAEPARARARTISEKVEGITQNPPVDVSVMDREREQFVS